MLYKYRSEYFGLICDGPVFSRVLTDLWFINYRPYVTPLFRHKLWSTLCLFTRLYDSRNTVRVVNSQFIKAASCWSSEINFKVWNVLSHDCFNPELKTRLTKTQDKYNWLRKDHQPKDHFDAYDMLHIVEPEATVKCHEQTAFIANSIVIELCFGFTPFNWSPASNAYSGLPNTYRYDRHIVYSKVYSIVYSMYTYLWFGELFIELMSS